MARALQQAIMQNGRTLTYENTTAHGLHGDLRPHTPATIGNSSTPPEARSFAQGRGGTCPRPGLIVGVAR